MASAFRLVPMIDQDAYTLFEAPNPTGSPERRLLLAVLERAILDYVGNDKKEVEQSEQWIFGDLDNPTNSPFSFPWLCRELDLDIFDIANKIRLMPKRGSSRIAPWYSDRRYFEKKLKERNTLRKEERQPRETFALCNAC